MSKQYGLIIPGKRSGGVTVTRPRIFDEDSDSDAPKASKPTGIRKTKRQDELNQQKAVEEDPTVYQYDEVYDEMENKKKESKLARKDIDKKPKYINRLLAAADKRKRENERRIERQVQKEREAEGEEFKDKESFVTSAYKKKLEEMKVLEEEEKREEYLEAIGDVRKQGNLDGFYRHLYDQKVNYEDRMKKQKDIKKESASDNENRQGKRLRKRSSASNSSEDNDTKIKKKSSPKKRKYRSRKSRGSDEDKSDSETEKIEIKKEHLPSNLDADSDFSVDSSSDEENDDKASKKKDTNNKKDDKIEHEGEKLQLPAKGNVLSDNAALSKKGDEKSIKSHKEEKESQKEDKPLEEKPKKPKIDIWKKRTVGKVYDEAVKKYFERKSARGW